MNSIIAMMVFLCFILSIGFLAAKTIDKNNGCYQVGMVLASLWIFPLISYSQDLSPVPIEDDQFICEKELPLILEAVKQGHAEAQAMLGELFLFGECVRQDDQLAFFLIQKAAEQGLAIAQNNIGWMYEIGRGVKQDKKQAVFWYEKAANQKNAGAQYAIGVIYKEGRGVVQDTKKAIFWFRKAANQGNSLAQEQLRNMGYGN